MWWWIFAAFMVGGCFGVIIMAICCANTRHDGKRWWEE